VNPLLLAGVGTLFAALVVAILAVLPPGGRRADVARTLRTVDNRYRVRGAGTAPAAPAKSALVQYAGSLGRALTPPAAVDDLNRRLDQAGNPQRLGLEAILDYKGLLTVVGAATGFVAGLPFLGPIYILLLTAARTAVGFFAPNLIVAHLAQERQEQIRRTLPDVIDILVVTVEAGLGFEAALAQVVRNGRGPMVGEFARVLHEMQFGRPRVDALRDMAARTTVAELKAFASAVVQATTLGVPMSNVLRQQAAEMRIRRRQRAEEMAQKVPVKILFPLVLCLLPALFVVVIGPGIVRLVAVFGHHP
jgi:pilus assembly protein TadC